MAGRGSRLRPHTLTVPKPMISVAGSPIVEQLIFEIARVVSQPINEVAFVLGDPAFFGKSVESELTKIVYKLGAKVNFYRQLEPLGTGHAVMCAADSLSGPVIIAYADTLIRSDLSIDPQVDGMIWVKKVKNPKAYGVVKLNQKKQIISLVEKPKKFISDMAVIGIYYFKDGEKIKFELNNFLKKTLEKGEEYLLNEGILSMIKKGAKFVPGSVNEWMDCGNPRITLETNKKMLTILSNEGNKLLADDVISENSEIIEPCYVGKGVLLKNSKIGPYVSIGDGSSVQSSTICNCLIQKNTEIKNAILERSMIGNNVKYSGKHSYISIGDYSELI